MPGLDFLYGGLGAADAITNLVAQRNFQQQQAALQAQKSAQQQFENNLLQTKTNAEAAEANARAMALNTKPAPAPAKPLKLEHIAGPNGPVTRWVDESDPTKQIGVDIPEYVAPQKETTPKTEAPDMYTMADGTKRRLIWESDTTHYLDPDTHEVVPSNQVGQKVPAPLQRDPLLEQLSQAQLDKMNSDRSVRAAAIKGYVHDIGESPSGLTLKDIPKDYQAEVEAELNKRGLTPEVLATQTLQRKQVAQGMLPHIDEIRDLAQQIDDAGLMGTVGSRFRRLAAGESIAAVFGDLTPAQQNLIGQFASKTGFLTSGSALAHSARGAAGPMMNAMKEYLDPSDSTLDTYKGKLQGAASFLNGYASVGEPVNGGDKAPSNPHIGTLWQSPTGKVIWNGVHWAPAGG